MENTCWLYNQCNHIDCNKDFCIKKYKLDALYKASLLSESQKRHITLRVDADGTDLKEFQQIITIENDIINFVNSGKNLYLHSYNCGNGKTSSALRLMESYFNKTWFKGSLDCRAMFISVPRFLLALKDSISSPSEYVNFIKTNIMKANLVVWDDIAAKTGTDFELNHLLSMIDGRIAIGKSNIYTSNLGTKEMYNAVGERLASRICNYSIDIELHGGDKRAVFNN